MFSRLEFKTSLFKKVMFSKEYLYIGTDFWYSLSLITFELHIRIPSEQKYYFVSIFQFYLQTYLAAD